MVDKDGGFEARMLSYTANHLALIHHLSGGADDFCQTHDATWRDCEIAPKLPISLSNTALEGMLDCAF
jgi:hypothetical protein